ncbi:MAG TPA: putative transporter [Bacteroidales bacterium]|nr:MAG: Aspartate/alanine antiporter [Bacteroidetes bacterium ADurb.Bin217]HPH15670.1 putative transporter [Bacteroidales bacterium]
MEDILQLFTKETTAGSLVILAIISITGILLGKIKIFNIKLGIAGVLFTGIIAGHLGAHVQHDVLHFIKEFGLILFVYSIGIDIGPRFIASFRNNGITINVLASSIVLLGFLLALSLKFIFNLDIEVIAGILSGSVTNTPSLGAAQTVISYQIPNGAELAPVAGMAYAVAYPFGILGIILVMLLLKKMYRISIPHEVETYQKELTGLNGAMHSIHVEVKNPLILGKTIEFVRASVDSEFVISRLRRNGDFIIPSNNTTIEQGDILYGVSTEDKYAALEIKIGTVHKTGRIEITGNLTMRHVLVTNRKIAGKTLQEIGISEQYPANITRIFRAGNEILPTSETTVEFGDTVRVVADRNSIDTVTKYLGNSQKSLSHPNLIPLFVGICLGIIVGSIPFFIPGLPAPAKLGLAGGPLIIALLLGHFGRIGSFDFYMTPGTNLFIRELGIVLFLSCVGLGSGAHFWESILSGGYMWMLYGAIITFVPILIVGIIARIMKINYLTICGVLAGSMTDPPALEFANSVAPVQAQSTAYATVYPLTMFLRILMAQILVLVLL